MLSVVLVSSGRTVYGVAQSLPIAEDHPTNPISPYGITKLTIEKYAATYRLYPSTATVIARPANAYRKGQLAFAGQGFIAAAMHSSIRREKVVIFHAKGTIRDYVPVLDVASGIATVLECGAPDNAYDIGSSTGRSNLDVLQEIGPHAARNGYSLHTECLPERRFDLPANVLDTRKLTAVSGCGPRVDVGAGVERMRQAVQASYRH